MWSSSSASTKRSRSIASSLSADDPDRAVGKLPGAPARPVADGSSTSSTPSRNERVASFASLAVRASEYGPRGLSSDLEHRAISNAAAAVPDTLRGGSARMRATWDALASDPRRLRRRPRAAQAELESLFGAARRRSARRHVRRGRLRPRPDDRGARRALRPRARARRLAGDARARARRGAGAERRASRSSPASGSTGSRTGSPTSLVCYLVLQHLPSREVVAAYLARVRPRARARRRGVRAAAGARPRAGPRAWRARASRARPSHGRRGPTRAAGVPRLPPDARRARRGARARRAPRRSRRSSDRRPYRFSLDLFLRLTR